MIGIDSLKKHLPDPYTYENNFFEVLLPMEIPDIDVNNISEFGPGPKRALFMKVNYVDADRRRTKRWQFVKIY